MRPVCTMCRRRPAVYHRTFSGDKLCLPCLRRQLERQVKRSLGSQGILKPRQRILVPITALAPLHSLALAELAARVEARYGSNVVVALNRRTVEVGGGTLSRLREAAPSIDEIEIIEHDIPRPLTLAECTRAERSIAITTAHRLGLDAVAMPITRDMLATTMIEATATSPEMLSESEEAWPGLVPAIAGLSRVESEAVSAYAALQGYDATPKCSANTGLLRLFKSAATGRPELVYSSSRSIALLAGEAGRRLGRCRICGGYTSGDVCRVCRMLGLG